ncbi:MAG: hypothetical protein HC810_01400 [Acaryochloridaceae cyanobacterium RL_2_7]|nr:hypothetical protein [Acaryochloridaceae cyanobacterium RL_2_7]
MANIRGTNVSDILNGTVENDRILGLGGNDTVIASIGDDTLDGGAGLNTADYSGLNAVITFESGQTVRKRGRGTDLVRDIDIIIGAEGQDNTISGRSTRDSDVPSFNNLLSFDIDLSEDRLTVSGVPGEGDVDFIVQNFVNVQGTSRDDSIVGDENDNRFLGRGGNDLLVGGAGNDTLKGGTGNDTLIGVDLSNPNSGPQIDTLNGGFGSDVFVLGTADEVFYNDHGREDFAKISRFSTNFDKIQLSGSIGDYTFSDDGRQIFERETNDLIAVVKNGLIDSDDLIFV